MTGWPACRAFGVLRVYVETPDGKTKVGGSLDAGHPDGAKLRQASFVLPKELQGEPMRLRAEIETKDGVRRPVRWACAQPLNPDGSLPFQLKLRGDPDWRKGV